jgi:hypothetical protein
MSLSLPLQQRLALPLLLSEALPELVCPLKLNPADLLQVDFVGTVGKSDDTCLGPELGQRSVLAKKRKARQ